MIPIKTSTHLSDSARPSRLRQRHVDEGRTPRTELLALRLGRQRTLRRRQRLSPTPMGPPRFAASTSTRCSATPDRSNGLVRGRRGEVGLNRASSLLQRHWFREPQTLALQCKRRVRKSGGNLFHLPSPHGYDALNAAYEDSRSRRLPGRQRRHRPPLDRPRAAHGRHRRVGAQGGRRVRGRPGGPQPRHPARASRRDGELGAQPVRRAGHRHPGRPRDGPGRAAVRARSGSCP